MKRSGFKRPERPERRPVILSPIRQLAAPIAREIVSTPKARILRSEPYRRYVSQFACMACGLGGPSQVAHANEFKGMGWKVCDSRTFPLCPQCHEELDQSRGMTREYRRVREREYVQAMQNQARADGRPETAFFPPMEATN